MSANLPPGVTQAMIDRALGAPECSHYEDYGIYPDGWPCEYCGPELDLGDFDFGPSFQLEIGR